MRDSFLPGSSDSHFNYAKTEKTGALADFNVGKNSRTFKKDMLSPQSSFSDKVLVVAEFAYVNSAAKGRQKQRSLALLPAHRPFPEFSQVLDPLKLKE